MKEVRSARARSMWTGLLGGLLFVVSSCGLFESNGSRDDELGDLNSQLSTAESQLRSGNRGACVDYGSICERIGNICLDVGDAPAGEACADPFTMRKSDFVGQSLACKCSGVTTRCDHGLALCDRYQAPDSRAADTGGIEDAVSQEDGGNRNGGGDAQDDGGHDAFVASDAGADTNDLDAGDGDGQIADDVTAGFSLRIVATAQGARVSGDPSGEGPGLVAGLHYEGGEKIVRAAFIGKDGQPIGDLFDIRRTLRTIVDGSITLAGDGSGGFIAVWTESENFVGQVMAARIQASGEVETAIPLSGAWVSSSIRVAYSSDAYAILWGKGEEQQMTSVLGPFGMPQTQSFPFTATGIGIGKEAGLGGTGLGFLVAWATHKDGKNYIRGQRYEVVHDMGVLRGLGSPLVYRAESDNGALPAPHDGHVRVRLFEPKVVRLASGNVLLYWARRSFVCDGPILDDPIFETAIKGFVLGADAGASTTGGPYTLDVLQPSALPERSLHFAVGAEDLYAYVTLRDPPATCQRIMTNPRSFSSYLLTLSETMQGTLTRQVPWTVISTEQRLEDTRGVFGVGGRLLIVYDVGGPGGTSEIRSVGR